MSDLVVAAVQMAMDDRSWHLVKSTPKITGFLGGQHPSPVPERDITGVQSAVTTGKTKPTPKVSYTVGDNVLVIDGPFTTFSGTIEDVNSDLRLNNPQIQIALDRNRIAALGLTVHQVETALFNAWEDAVECAKCGGRLVRSGSCYTCRDCGTNTGCS